MFGTAMVARLQGCVPVPVGILSRRRCHVTKLLGDVEREIG